MQGQQFQTGRIPIKRKTQRKKGNNSKVCIEEAFPNLLNAIKVTKIVLKEAPINDASIFENIAIGMLIALFFGYTGQLCHSCPSQGSFV